jgi:2,5-dihydroxypyridine 5,6-dioxygenase
MLRDANDMRVTSAAGTDLLIDLRGAPCGGTPGFGTTPGSVAHWPGGLCLAFPGKNAVNGRIVMDVGDMNLTFKTTLTSQIDFTVEDDFVTAIKGDGIDAIHFREYMDAWNDRNAYGMSHVGWGMHPGARAGCRLRCTTSATCRRWSSARWPDRSSGRRARTSMPAVTRSAISTCRCATARLLDGKVVVKNGVLQGELAL